MFAKNLLQICKLFRIATIQVPIRNLKLFCTQYPLKLKAKIEKIERSIIFESPNQEDLDDYLRQIFSSIRLRDLNYWRNVYLKDVKEQIERLERIGKELLTTKLYTLDYFRFFIGSLQEIERMLRSMLKLISTELSYSETHEERYSYYLRYPDENISDGKLYFAILKLPQELEEILKEIKYYLPALEENARVFTSNMYGKEDDPPKSESEEFLYHTTINADKIFSTGFSRQNVKTEGLGGSQETRSGKKSISFTYDLFVAKEIARCLKEAILIAKGKVDGYDILEWSTNQEEILQSMTEIYHKFDLSTAKDSFNLYRIYLALNKNRYDPLFFGSAQEFISIFGTKNQQDVGIIKAKIDMTNQDIAYFQAMKEYRVPPEAVISIEGIIR